MAQQRDDEAAVIAQICSKLIRAMEIEDEHTGDRGLLAVGDIPLLAPTSGATNAHWKRAGLPLRRRPARRSFCSRRRRTSLRCRARGFARPACIWSLHARSDGARTKSCSTLPKRSIRPAPRPPTGLFDITTRPWYPMASPAPSLPCKNCGRVNVTTPRILLAEAIEQLQLRVALSVRSGNNRAARRIVELARPFDVRGLRAFVRHLQLDWDRRASRQEGRIEASRDGRDRDHSQRERSRMDRGRSPHVRFGFDKRTRCAGGRLRLR